MTVMNKLQCKWLIEILERQWWVQLIYCFGDSGMPYMFASVRHEKKNQNTWKKDSCLSLVLIGAKFN